MVGITRGEIWLVDLNPVQGSEQRGIRPCLIVSNNVVNRHASTVCVVPLTSNLSGERFPINVRLAKSDADLRVDSLVLCGQLRTVAKERLMRKLSVLKIEKMSEIEIALRIYLGM